MVNYKVNQYHYYGGQGLIPGRMRRNWVCRGDFTLVQYIEPVMYQKSKKLSDY